MAFEKIDYKDSLRAGTDKLNGAIDGAKTAYDTANTAKSTADDAKTTADSVQEQFNQVVIDGDSSVEAAQARVTADGTSYTTLKERLDTEHGDVTTQLAQNTQHVNDIALIPRRQSGEITDSPAIRRVLDEILSKGFGKLFIPFPSITIDEPITIYSDIVYEGNSKMGTEIKLADGANCDVFKTDHFEELSTLHNGGTYPSNYYDILPKGFQLKNFYVNGNRENNTTGFGLKIYARNYEIDNVRVEKTAEVGAYFECKDSETGKLSIQITETGKEGLIYRGANDQTLDGINVGKTGLSAINADGTINTTANVSDIYPSDVINGIVIDCACEINEIHSWECKTGYAIKYTTNARTKNRHVVVDNSLKGVHLDNCITQMPLLDAHNITSDSLRMTGNTPQMVGLSMFRYSTDVTFGDQIIVDGNNNVLDFVDYDGNLVSGACINYLGYNNRINGTVRNYTQSDVLKYNGGYRNDINLIVENCLNVIGVNSNLYQNHLNVQGLLRTGQTLYQLRNSSSIDFQRSIFDILLTYETSGTIDKNLTSKYAATHGNVVDLTVTTVQNVTVPHTFYRTPFAHEIDARVNTYASITDYAIDFVKTTTITDSQVTFQIKLSQASATTDAKASLLMKIS